MTSNRGQVKQALRDACAARVDAWMATHGFKRRADSLIFRRNLGEAVQSIDITFELRPLEKPSAIAAVYPWLEVKIARIEEVVNEMVGADPLLRGLSGSTLRQPIDMTSGKKSEARWLLDELTQSTEVSEKLKRFLEAWTVPFLDRFSTVEGVCACYDAGATGVMLTLPVALRCAAAMSLAGRRDDAIQVLERWFGRPGPRKAYRGAFQYLGVDVP